jgi:AAA family ATP:ADP antiporter
LAGADPGEIGVSCRSFAGFFCLLCGYYVLRPVRDEMGVQGGVENPPWLFSMTFVFMLAVGLWPGREHSRLGALAPLRR